MSEISAATQVFDLDAWAPPLERTGPGRRELGPLRRDAILRRALAVADLVAAVGTMLVLGAFGHHGVVAILAVVLIVPLAKLLGRYDREQLVLRKSTLEEFPRLVSLAGAFALTWSAVAEIASWGGQADRAALVWFVAAVLLALMRTVARTVTRATTAPERVLIVGDARARMRISRSLASDPSARLEVVTYLPFEQQAADDAVAGQLTAEDIRSVVEELRIDRVLVVPDGDDSEHMPRVIGNISAAGVKLSIVPSLLEVLGSAVEFDTVGGVTVLGVRPPGLSRSSALIKRGMDVIGAGIGLLLLSPVLAAVALAVRLDSKGPVFFRQPRVGRLGRTFAIIKFRSMVDGADAQRAALGSLNETDGLFKLSKDPRVTRVGRFIRSTSIDELPQLFNVLRGDMSLVGPRPLVLDEDRLIEGHHRSRLLLAPGMTGPWQVLGPSRPPLSEMVKTDYLYAANWSLWSDVKIMLRTVAHVSARRGV